MKQFKYRNQVYYVSEDGLVFKNDTLLSQYDDGNGYKSVVLSDTPHCVHKLIATVYLPNPDNKSMVYHKNGIITDNRVKNLEWKSSTDLKENHSSLIEKKWKSGRGLKRPIKQFDNETGQLLQIFDSLGAAATHLNVHAKSIWSAINHPNLCKGYKFTYA